MSAKRVQEMTVHELLALGEGLASRPEESQLSEEKEDDGSDSDSSGSFEDVELPDAEVDRTENGVSADGIVITVEAPTNVRRKKRNEFDAEAFIRRKLAQRSRELQLSLHKAHIVCIFASVKFTNQHVLNSPELQAVALSVVPSSECYPGKRADLDYLEKLTTWFMKKFKVSSSVPVTDEAPQKAVERVFREKKTHDSDMLVYAFVVLTRAMGLSSRLVVNFRPLPAKLTVARTSTGGAANEEDQEPKPCSSKSVLASGECSVKEKKIAAEKKVKPAADRKISPVKKRQKTEADQPFRTEKDSTDSSDDEVVVPKTTKGKAGDSTQQASRSSSRSKKVAENNVGVSASSSKGRKEQAKEPSKPAGALQQRKKSSVKPVRKEESSDEEILRSNEPADTKPPKKVEVANDESASRRRSSRAASVAAKKKIEKTEKIASDEEEPKSKSSISGRIAAMRAVSAKASDEVGKSKRAPSSDNPGKTKSKTTDESSDKKKSVKEKAASASRKRKSHEVDEDNDDSDDDFKPQILKVQRRSVNSGSVDRRVLSSDDEAAGPSGLKSRKGQNTWAEVYVEQEEKWICVDVTVGKIYCVKEVQSKASKPLYYIVAFNNDGSAKDVTPRYDPNWGTNTKKHRVDPGWWRETMKSFLEPKTRRSKEEDAEFQELVQQQPLPTSIAAYKNHPLYALSRHLLKFEAIYPLDAPPLGYVRGEAVYARECIHQLHSRETWIKEALVVRPGEKPYNVVKARPKYDKSIGDWVKDKPLEVFGKWQTKPYEPPVAENGIVPRNAFGNVELFKPSMLPIGCVHMRIPQLNRIAKKLGIDCAPAMVGWDYHGGWSHPSYDGFVVCAEFEDTLRDAYDQEMAMQAKKDEEKRLKRIYTNWRRLVRGVLIKERIKNRYLDGESSQDAFSTWLDSPPKLEDSSEDEQEEVAAPSKEKRKIIEDEDLTLAAKIRKLAELEKLLGKKAPAAAKRKPRASAGPSKRKTQPKAQTSVKRGKAQPKRKSKADSPPAEDPFSSSSDEKEEEDFEAVRKSIKAGIVPKKTYSTRGANKSYKESESEDDGDLQMSEASDEEGYA